MGYARVTLLNVLQIIKEYFPNLSELKMLELGNQYIDRNECSDIFQSFSYTSSSIFSADFFKAIGFSVVSTDYNHQDNTYYCDLKIPSNDTQLLNTFSLITDLGTLEHVGQDEPNEQLLLHQYNALKNFHEFGKENCIYYHILPLKGYWYKHGACDYTIEFWIDFCKLCKYTLLQTEIVNYRPDLQIGITYKKTEHSIFPSFDEFLKLNGIRSTFYD